MKKIPVMILLLSLVFCGPPVRIKRYPVSASFAPTAAESVTILRHQPRRPHIQLGEVIVDPSPSTPREEVQWILRREAARLGAHAVVVVVDNVYRRQVVGRRWWRRVRVVRDRVIVGIAIRYR